MMMIIIISLQQQQHHYDSYSRILNAIPCTPKPVTISYLPRVPLFYNKLV